MTKKTETRYTWGIILDDFESRVREGWVTGRHPDMRGYMVTLRTMQRIGAKRDDDTPYGTSGEALIDKEMAKSHAEWDDYVRVQQIFSPHIKQYRRIMFPDPSEDFHAAWVKAGEE